MTTDLLTSRGLVERKFIEWTNWFKGEPILTPEEGGVNTTWAAVGRGEMMPKSGEYYKPVGMVGKPSKASADAEMAKSLWEWTDSELKTYTV